MTRPEVSNRRKSAYVAVHSMRWSGPALRESIRFVHLDRHEQAQPGVGTIRNGQLGANAVLIVALIKEQCQFGAKDPPCCGLHDQIATGAQVPVLVPDHRRRHDLGEPDSPQGAPVDLAGSAVRETESAPVAGIEERESQRRVVEVAIDRPDVVAAVLLRQRAQISNPYVRARQQRRKATRHRLSVDGDHVSHRQPRPVGLRQDEQHLRFEMPSCDTGKPATGRAERPGEPIDLLVRLVPDDRRKFLLELRDVR